MCLGRFTPVWCNPMDESGQGVDGFWDVVVFFDPVDAFLWLLSCFVLPLVGGQPSISWAPRRTMPSPMLMDRSDSSVIVGSRFRVAANASAYTPLHPVSFGTRVSDNLVAMPTEQSPIGPALFFEQNASLS